MGACHAQAIGWDTGTDKYDLYKLSSYILLTRVPDSRSYTVVFTGVPATPFTACNVIFFFRKIRE